MPKIKYEEMQPDELAAARQDAPLVYVPIGSTEYHGLHLPVGFDAMHAYELCLRSAEQTGGVVVPATFWGTRGHEKYPASLLLQEETIAALMRDVLDRLTAHEYRLIVVCTGHYPKVQGELIKGVAEEHMKVHPEVRVMVLNPFDLHPTDPHPGHAGIIETSVMLYLRPELVDMQQLTRPGALRGIRGDCVDATPEYGRKRFETVLEAMIQVVKSALHGI